MENEEELTVEIDRDINRLRRAAQIDVKGEIVMTLLPYLKSIAAEVADHRDALADLLTEAAGGDTQFAAEDAQRFALVIAFALNAAEQLLKAGVDEDTKAQCRTIIEHARHCASLVEERALEEDEGDEEEAPPDSGAVPNVVASSP